MAIQTLRNKTSIQSRKAQPPKSSSPTSAQHQVSTKNPTETKGKKTPSDSVTLSKESQEASKSRNVQNPTEEKAPTGTNVDVEAITQTPDREQRNRQVTQGYHEIFKGLDETINPPGSPDGGVNWGTHATWASKEAGKGIRGEGLPVVGSGQVPEALSEGNTRVFKDIGPDMQSFSKEFSKSKCFNQEEFNQWADQRFQGEEAHLKREAFESYYKARFEEDQKKKQEMVLYGNAKIGEYEQTVLDPDIDKAMTPVDGPKVLVDTARELGTQGMPGVLNPMTLSHPDGQGGTKVANLSKNVDGNPPETLSNISDPKLREAMEKYGVDPNTPNGGDTASRDWSDYNDRMGWIVQHFRANQMNRDMITTNPQPDQVVNLPRNDGSDLRDSPLPAKDSQSDFMAAFMSNYAA